MVFVKMTAEQIMIAEKLCWEFLDKNEDLVFLKKLCEKECENKALLERFRYLMEKLAAESSIQDRLIEYVETVIKEEVKNAKKTDSPDNKIDLDKDS